MRPFLYRFPAVGGLLLFALLCAAIASLRYAAARQAGPKLFPTQQSTIIVTTTNDDGPGSLRQAIADAQDGDIIGFDPALNGQTISLTSSELLVDRNIAINGPGPNLLTVSRDSQAPAFRIFHVMAGHTVTIQGLTISGGFDYGGAILNSDASLSIISCTIRDNVSSGSGGAIFNSATSANATLTILDSTITGNRADSWGGGIYNQAFEFVGANLTLTNSVVSYNQALDPMSGSGLGGGICSLPGVIVTLYNSTVSHNIAGATGLPTPGGHGGGIAINGCTLTITNSTISDNQSGATGGGIENQSGSLTITNSSLIGNRAFGTGDNGPVGRGGGIYTGGLSTITNSTLSDNYAGVSGGGIFHTFNTERLTIAHSTLSGNRADEDGGGIFNSDALEIGDTILKAGSAGANILNKGGTVTSHGYNLSSDDGGGVLTATGDQINTDPILGPLQNNGGPTFTYALLPGSPAINTGDPNFTPPPLTDQRGYLRVFNGRIDIGSFEVQPVPTPTPTPSATPTPTPTATPSPARLFNISTRVRVETGDNVMIGGFILAGADSLQVVIRGIGPSLGQQGISDFLPDPIVELRNSSGTLLATNDNWQDDPTQATQLLNLGLAPGNQTESALLWSLQPGAYTAIIAGKNGGTGLGLVEVYNADPSVPAANVELANISTRGLVQTGNNVMIGGFILGSTSSSSTAGIVVRGIGPTLAQSGVSNVLADPTLELRDDNGMLLVANDNWQDDPISAAELIARGLAPQNPFESGIFVSLQRGLYTAILAGNNGGTGIGLVEIYNVH